MEVKYESADGRTVYRIMESKHIYLKLRTDVMSGGKIWDDTELNKLLGQIDIGDLVNIAYTPDMSECVVIYLSEVYFVNRRVHDSQLRTVKLVEKPEPKPINLNPETTALFSGETPEPNPFPDETPLGEQIDSETEETDAQQETLF